MFRIALSAIVLLLVTGCGSDGDDAARTTTAATPTVSAADAESALETELSEGGGGGIVQLEPDTPKQVTCKREAGTQSEWSCTVTPSKGGESYLCMIEIDPQTKRATNATCGRIDN